MRSRILRFLSFHIDVLSIGIGYVHAISFRLMIHDLSDN